MLCRRLGDTSLLNRGSLNQCVSGFGFPAEKYCSTVGLVGAGSVFGTGGFDHLTARADATNRTIRISGGNSFFIGLNDEARDAKGRL